MSSQSDYLTIEDVVALFPGRTRGAIYAERHLGLGLGAMATLVGKRLYWKRSAVDEWFDQKQARDEAERASTLRG